MLTSQSNNKYLSKSDQPPGWSDLPPMSVYYKGMLLRHSTWGFKLATAVKHDSNVKKNPQFPSCPNGHRFLVLCPGGNWKSGLYEVLGQISVGGGLRNTDRLLYGLKLNKTYTFFSGFQSNHIWNQVKYHLPGRAREHWKATADVADRLYSFSLKKKWKGKNHERRTETGHHFAPTQSVSRSGKFQGILV